MEESIGKSKLKNKTSKPLVFKIKPIKWDQLSKEVRDTISKTGKITFKQICKAIDDNSDLILREDGLYQMKDKEIYPTAHPDLSTQPSVLAQRFGNLPIKEVLIAYGRENEIPSDATVISAFSFNKTTCVPAVCQKTDSGWSITNSLDITPDFTLVQYVGADNVYYYYGYGEGDTLT